MLRLTGELEQLILKILKEENKPLIPAEVQELLKPNKELAYTTVMTVLKRLYQKKLLKREKHGSAYAYYLIKYEADDRELKNIFEELLNSYGELAISNFIDSVNTKPEHKEMLEDYLKNEQK
jgi:predicted transcriptional regulator